MSTCLCVCVSVQKSGTVVPLLYRAERGRFSGPVGPFETRRYCILAVYAQEQYLARPHGPNLSPPMPALCDVTIVVALHIPAVDPQAGRESYCGQFVLAAQQLARPAPRAARWKGRGKGTGTGPGMILRYEKGTGPSSSAPLAGMLSRLHLSVSGARYVSDLPPK